MLGLLSAYDESEKCGSKDRVSFIHIEASSDEDIEIEVSPLALELARKFNLNKVYLFYGKDKKLIYDYSL